MVRKILQRLNAAVSKPKFIHKVLDTEEIVFSIKGKGGFHQQYRIKHSFGGVEIHLADINNLGESIRIRPIAGNVVQITSNSLDNLIEKEHEDGTKQRNN